MPVSALTDAPHGTFGAATKPPTYVLSLSAFTSISETLYCACRVALPVTDAGGLCRLPSQECQPDSNELSSEENPAASEADASEIAAAWLESKASASVKVVVPLAATGICASW